MRKTWADEVKMYRDKWEPMNTQCYAASILKGPALNKAHCLCNHWA